MNCRLRGTRDAGIFFLHPRIPGGITPMPGEPGAKKAPRPEGREAKYPNVKFINSYIISGRTQGLIFLHGPNNSPAREKSLNAMDSHTVKIREKFPASFPWKNRQAGYPGTDAAHHSMYSPLPVFKPPPLRRKTESIHAIHGFLQISGVVIFTAHDSNLLPRGTE